MMEELPTTHSTLSQTPTALLGLIGGSSLLKSRYFANAEKIKVETSHGPVVLHFGRLVGSTASKNVYDFIFCQRHMADPSQNYVPPHLINTRAIIDAFHRCRVEKILAFGSVGSLSEGLHISTIVVPDDFFNIWETISFFTDKRSHIVPSLESKFRDEVIQVLKDNRVEPLRIGGTYVQTTGPRFETKAEVRFIATVGDVVGMTAAHEIILCGELGIPYALICMVDNMGNGIEFKKLTMEEFENGLALNEKKVEGVLGQMLGHFVVRQSK